MTTTNIPALFAMIRAADNHDTTALAHLYETHIESPLDAAHYLCTITELGGYGMRNGQRTFALAATINDDQHAAEQEAALRTAISMITIAANQPHDPELQDFAIATIRNGFDHTMATITAALSVIASEIRDGLFAGIEGVPQLDPHPERDNTAHQAAAQAVAQTIVPWDETCPDCVALRDDTYPGTAGWIEATATHFTQQHTDRLTQIDGYPTNEDDTLEVARLPWVDNCDLCTSYRTHAYPEHDVWQTGVTTHLMNAHTRTPDGEDWSS